MIGYRSKVDLGILLAALLITKTAAQAVQPAPTTCTEQQIDDCLLSNPTAKHLNFPLPLNIPNVDDFCRGFQDYSDCVNSYKPHCDFTRNKQFRAFHDMCAYICNDKAAYTLYKDEITDGVNHVKWTTCGTAAGIKGLAGSEHGSDTCKKLDVFYDCYDNVDASTRFKTYIQQMARGTNRFYSDHYGCSLSPKVTAMNLGLHITALFVFLCATREKLF